VSSTGPRKLFKEMTTATPGREAGAAAHSVFCILLYSVFYYTVPGLPCWEFSSTNMTGLPNVGKWVPVTSLMAFGPQWLLMLAVGGLAGSAGHPLASSGRSLACAVRGVILPRAQTLRLRGSGPSGGRQSAAEADEMVSGRAAASNDPVPAGNAAVSGARAGGSETMGGDEGLASALLREIKDALRQGEIPSAAEKRRETLLPKSGPGSIHRTEPLHGWTKNLGGNFGIELPEGGLAGGGYLPEPLRVEWAKRLANSSDTAAIWGHKLVQLCDNVSVGLDPYTGKGPFYLDAAAALQCLEQVPGPPVPCPAMTFPTLGQLETPAQRVLDHASPRHCQ
jgi:hypothetical protein